MKKMTKTMFGKSNKNTAKKCHVSSVACENPRRAYKEVGARFDSMMNTTRNKRQTVIPVKPSMVSEG